MKFYSILTGKDLDFRFDLILNMNRFERNEKVIGFCTIMGKWQPAVVKSSSMTHIVLEFPGYKKGIFRFL